MMFLTPGTSCSAWRGCGAADHRAPRDLDLARADVGQDRAGVALDLVLERAGRRRELDRERDGGAVDDDRLDHLEGDDVAPELGLLDGAQCLEDGAFGDRGHRRRSASRSVTGVDGRSSLRCLRELGDHGWPGEVRTGSPWTRRARARSVDGPAATRARGRTGGRPANSHPTRPGTIRTCAVPASLTPRAIRPYPRPHPGSRPACQGIGRGPGPASPGGAPRRSAEPR